MGEEKEISSVNRAKLYQLILFPFNNGATNVYYILTLNYIAYHANGVLGLALMFATPLSILVIIFKPFVWILNKMSSVFKGDEAPTVTEDELKYMIDEIENILINKNCQ